MQDLLKIKLKFICILTAFKRVNQLSRNLKPISEIIIGFFQKLNPKGKSDKTTNFIFDLVKLLIPTIKSMCILKMTLYGRWAEKATDHAHFDYLISWLHSYGLCQISLLYLLPIVLYIL